MCLNEDCFDNGVICTQNFSKIRRKDEDLPLAKSGTMQEMETFMSKLCMVPFQKMFNTFLFLVH